MGISYFNSVPWTGFYLEVCIERKWEFTSTLRDLAPIFRWLVPNDICTSGIDPLKGHTVRVFNLELFDMIRKVPEPDPNRNEENPNYEEGWEDSTGCEDGLPGG
jgi:hypothetical protein